ncbi:MAG TPA: hypothetical protein VGD77_05475 [Gemmatimonadaceae bacterium]
MAAPVMPSAASTMTTAAAPRSASDLSLRLAALHFTASTLFLLAGSAGLLWIAPLLAGGLFPERGVAAVTHLFTLGWITTTILGALYQLLPVALGAPVKWERLGHASIWTFAPGIALFVAGVATGQVVLHHAGIALVTTGIVIALVNFASSLRRATARDTTWWGIAIALGFLASTLVLGVVLLHNIHTGFLGAARLRVLGVHLHVAIGGFVLVLMIGVSQRLLPMFLLAHGVSDAWARRALVVLPLGVATLATGLATAHPGAVSAGAVLMAAGVAFYATQVRALFRARVRRKVDPGMRFVATSFAFVAAAVVLGLVVAFTGAAAHPRIATAYVIAAIPGAVGLFLTGHAYKVIPMLAWTAHYRGRMGRGAVPTVADTWSARWALAQLALMALGTTIMGAGTLAGHAHCVRMGAALFTAGTLIFAAQLWRVAHGPRT